MGRKRSEMSLDREERDRTNLLTRVVRDLGSALGLDYTDITLFIPRNPRLFIPDEDQIGCAIIETAQRDCVFDAFRQFLALPCVREYITKERNILENEWHFFDKTESFRRYIIKYMKDNSKDYKYSICDEDISYKGRRPLRTEARFNLYLQQLEKPREHGRKVASNLEFEAITKKCGIQVRIFNHHPMRSELHTYCTMPSLDKWDLNKPVILLYYHVEKEHISLLLERTQTESPLFSLRSMASTGGRLAIMDGSAI